MSGKEYSVREFQRVLSNNGWRIATTNGSHIKYKHEKHSDILTITSKKISQAIARRLIRTYGLTV